MTVWKFTMLNSYTERLEQYICYKKRVYRAIVSEADTRREITFGRASF